MTIPILMMLGCGAGASMAAVSEKALSRTPMAVRTRYFLTTLMFAGLLTVAGVSLYAAYPDWSLMYLANPAHLPWAFVYPLLVFVYLSLPPVAFLVTQRVLLAHRPWLVRSLLIALGAVGSVFLLLAWERLMIVAHYDAFHHGLARIPILESPLFTMSMLHSLALLGAMVFVVRALAKHAAIVDAPALSEVDRPVPSAGPRPHDVKSDKERSSQGG